MKDKLKNAALALFFVIFIIGFAVIIYNTFIRKEPEKPKTELTRIDRSDRNYTESNDPYSDSYIPESEIDEDIVRTNNSYYTNGVINYEINNTKFSFGIDSNSSLPGIVLNPSIYGDKQYIAIIQADHGDVTINEENQKYLMEDFDSNIYVKSMKGWTVSNARYVNDENYGCYYSVYLDDLIDTDYIRVRLLDKDNLNLEYMLNLRVDNVGDKYSITEISNGNIYNYDEHNYTIENAIKDSGTKYFNSETNWTVTSTLLGDTSGFYDIKLSEGKYDRIKSIADISSSDKPIKVATLNMQNDYGISICCYFTDFDGIVIGFDYISKYEIINDQFMHNASLCGMYPELAKEYGFNPDGSVILDDSETLSMDERLMIEELIRSEGQTTESNEQTAEINEQVEEAEEQTNDIITE